MSNEGKNVIFDWIFLAKPDDSRIIPLFRTHNSATIH